MYFNTSYFATPHCTYCKTNNDCNTSGLREIMFYLGDQLLNDVNLKQKIVFVLESLVFHSNIAIFQFLM